MKDCYNQNHGQKSNEPKPTLSEVRQYIKGNRAATAPGPNDIDPLQVYMNCPRLSRRLCKLIKVVWRSGENAGQLDVGRGLLHSEKRKLVFTKAVSDHFNIKHRFV